MQHAEYFKTFLNDEVNLNQSRIGKLESRVDAVYNALVADTEIGTMITSKFPQGSWPHKLIIKPTTNGDFDADFLLAMSHQENWRPTAYIDAVYNALHRHSTYSKQDHGRKCRCVWLKYAPEEGIGCHLDIVPFITLPSGRRVIVNRDEDKWEPALGSTDPQGFTNWVRRRDELTNKQFRKVVRLMKYLKRERGSFNGVKSVVLTTLLGLQVTELNAITPGRYSNTPTALVNIVEDLDRFLQAQGDTRPFLANPSDDGTDFHERWTDETYRNFRDRIHTIAADMRSAYDQTDPSKSAIAWQKLFGEKFDPPVGKQASTSANPYAAAVPALGIASSRSGRAG
ncbi:SMODS domain-containing nucleotidyltransferase [Phytoactinopolyspora halotolerans]|uniref:Nucleotidyltransferase n=1 Tax=Phytoactinopolyspora halotolerans TaxID=1981512 RepID=A0A6L9SJX2_9ACTN|nr:nucleotidyltransferase [Phytoactinopolyspora halotolerans]NEE04611.1 nucleotidyltransferase [Phytoactinopolyspora halotolerans]